MLKHKLQFITWLLLFIIPRYTFGGYPQPVVRRPAARFEPTATTNLRICALRVSFVPDANPATTGNGRFLSINTSQCNDFIVDPPPHNRAYFHDHLRALNNYYTKVSQGKVTIDTLHSVIYPLVDSAAYQLPHTMDYYHPFLQADSVDLRLTELFVDAVRTADPEVDFSAFDLVIVFHAGLGQDFNIFLDPTPFDIPSGYINPLDLKNLMAPDDPAFNGIPVDDGTAYIDRGLILPETQNHLLYDNWQDVFGNVEQPCELQIGLNGTLALVFGFYLGLPALYDTETGSTGIGKFGLMDQGSINLNGLVPAVPSAWERAFLGWEIPAEPVSSALIQLTEVESGSEPKSYRVNLNATEYFLIENRNAHVRPGVSLDSIRYRLYAENGFKNYPSLFPLIRDTLKASFSPKTGVLLDIPKYDYGLPGSGLLIWHIDEAVIQANLAQNRINADKERRGVDLEEGDGAQDLGYDANTLYTDVNIGWYFDPWFAGNEGFFHLNPDYPVDTQRRVGFTPFTNPATHTNDYLYTGISIDSIGPAGSIMEFRIIKATTPGSFPLSCAAPIKFISPILRQANDVPTAFILASDSTYLYDATGEKRSSLPLQERYAVYNATLTGFATLQDSIIQITTWRVTDAGQFEQLYQVQIPNHYLADSPLAIGTKILFTARSLANPTYRLGLYEPFKTDIAWFDLEAPLVQILGDSTGCYAVRSDDYLCQITLNPLNCLPLRSLPNLSTGCKVLAYLNANQELDLVHYYNQQLTIYFDINTSATAVKRDIALGNELICGDIDRDGKIEIVSYDDHNIYAFNQDLKFEYNFPLALPNILQGDQYTGSLRLCDIDGDGSKDLLIATTCGLVAFDAQGKLLPNYPLNFQAIVNNTGFLLSTHNGVSFYALTGTAQVSAALLGPGRLQKDDWLSAGRDCAQSYRYPLSPTETPRNSDRLLDPALTFNWPNPVQAELTYLRYYVLNACKVTIKVYDLTGDLIATLEDNAPQVGEYNEKEWHLGDLPNGVYFAVVQARSGSRSENKVIKIMVIR